MPPVEAIAIGCSMGGLAALRHLLRDLDPALPAAVLVCTHTSSPDVSTLCELLQAHSSLPVMEAGERQRVSPGVVQLAPSGYHLLVEPARTFALSVDPPVCFSRPSVDVMFMSAAHAYADRLAGVVLTGASADGADGMSYVRKHGGIAIVQDPGDAQAPAMPRAALELAGADHCLPLAQIAPLLNRLCLPRVP